VTRRLDCEAHAPVYGEPLVALDAEGNPEGAVGAPGTIVLGLDVAGRLPAVAAGGFDLLLTTAHGAPRPWVYIAPEDFDRDIRGLDERVCAQPLAASTLAQVLRVGESLSLADALVVESLAYSMLLGGPGFRRWRAEHPPRPGAPDDQPRVQLHFEEGRMEIRLTRPERRNAFDARMRDALVEALRVVEDHPSAGLVTLCGEGPDFSAGGDLDEFGSTPDGATAHAIRTLRSPALLVSNLRDRITVRLHGACIGAGIEVPAAAGRVVARHDAWFRLPEVGMGLIPGAGGTATLPRRIGRHRTLYAALTGYRLAAPVAREWGLFDEVVEQP
jgi:enoyl-CoA hydratase/carnithine racemase